MDNKSEFNEKLTGDETSLHQFRIEVADNGEGKFFYIKPLGHHRFEISNDEGSIGTIQLDETDHARCESQGCELDLPLLHAIREQIHFHLSGFAKP